MAVYKQVMSESTNINNEQIKQVTSDSLNSPVQMEESDETFEYFSDKEEAEKHRKTKKQKPRIL